ncbi:MAG TPA: helix-turn-helix domain-containing protein [Sporichthyaceae bacterium]|jgi:sugar diacid utilization regulator/putative methionine-R-sulfoxide reductase with GAF domain|nr:helix-turn-helix domain-containing protein [Sporichthyaceae bacterium]
MNATPGADWPVLVERVLGAGASATAAKQVVAEAVAAASGADGVGIIEWVRDRPSTLYRLGVPPILATRLPPGPTRLLRRPVVVAPVDDHRDLVVARPVGADDFTAAEVAAVRAAATLLARAAALGAREAAETLQRLTREIVGTLDLDRVLLSIANTAARLLASEVAGVFLVHGPPGEQELRMRCSVGHSTPDTARLRVPAGRGMAGKVLATGKPSRIDDYPTTEAITKDYLSIAIEEGTRSGLGVPMLDAAGEIIGVLGAWRLRPSVYSDEDEQLLVSLAGLAAIGLVNAEAYERAQQAGAELEAARQDLEGRLAVSDEALEIHRRLTAIAAEGSDLGALAHAVHAVVRGRVHIVPSGDRVPARWPAGAGEPPRPHEVPDVRRATTAQRGGRQWVRVAIDAAGVRHGMLFAELPGPPRRLDVVTLEQSATICALLLGHSAAVAASTARLRSEFVWELLEGRRTDDADEAVRAVSLGLRLTFPARILLFRAAGLRTLAQSERWTAQQVEHNLVWLADRVGSAVAQHVLPGSRPDRGDGLRSGPGSVPPDWSGNVVPMAHRDEQVVAILPADADAAHIARTMLGRCPFAGVELAAGVSRSVPDVESLPHGLHEARVALSAVDPQLGPVVCLDDLGVLQFLIAPADADDLRRFADSVLGRLLEYDRVHDAGLVETLDRWFEHGGNAASTARSLNVHAKTLAYRLRRIAEVGGVDLADRRHRLDAELSLRILGLRHVDPRA